MITDLVQIKLLGEKKRDENERFRAHMKTHDHSDRILRRIARRHRRPDRLHACANCCRVATVNVSERDIERLAHIPAHQARRSSSPNTPWKTRKKDLDPAPHRRDRLRLPERQRMHRLRCAPRHLPAISPRGPRRRPHRQPHVAVHRPRLLLPHRLQFARSLQRRNGLQALSSHPSRDIRPSTVHIRGSLGVFIFSRRDLGPPHASS